MIEFCNITARLRKRIPALRSGSVIELLAADGVIAYGRMIRGAGGSGAVVVVNTCEEARTVLVPVWKQGVTEKDWLNRVMLTYEHGYNVGQLKVRVDDGIAAGVILTGRSHSDAEVPVEQIRIAFDGDAVLFSAESERIFRHRGVDAFIRHEQDRADIPLAEGPFAGFLKALSRFQNIRGAGGEPVVRTALVTSRNLPAQARAIRTLRAWGVRVDEAVFLGGMEKQDVLAAFGAHIFFDDQRKHADRAQEVVQAAVVPYREGDDPASPPEGE